MEIKGQVYRQGGQWKIVIQTEAWILDDILRDVEKQTRAIITVHNFFDQPPYPNGGGTSFYLAQDKTHLLGTVLFEEESNKKADY